MSSSPAFAAVAFGALLWGDTSDTLRGHLARPLGPPTQCGFVVLFPRTKWTRSEATDAWSCMAPSRRSLFPAPVAARSVDACGPRSGVVSRIATHVRRRSTRMLNKACFLSSRACEKCSAASNSLLTGRMCEVLHALLWVIPQTTSFNLDVLASFGAVQDVGALVVSWVERCPGAASRCALRIPVAHCHPMPQPTVLRPLHFRMSMFVRPGRSFRRLWWWAEAPASSKSCLALPLWRHGRFC